MLHGNKAQSSQGSAAWRGKRLRLDSTEVLRCVIYLQPALHTPTSTMCTLVLILHATPVRDPCSQLSPANNLLPSRALVSSISSFHLCLGYLSASHQNDWLPPHIARKLDNADWSSGWKPQQLQKWRGTRLGVCLGGEREGKEVVIDFFAYHFQGMNQRFLPRDKQQASALSLVGLAFILALL